MTIYIFGDSIVWGAFDFLGFGWARRIGSFLKKRFGIKTYVFGINGDDTQSLLNRFPADLKGASSYIVIFAIGINDSQIIGGKNRVLIEKFSENLDILVKKAKDFSDRIIFIGLTRVDEKKAEHVWWARERSYNNEVISKYDSTIEEVSKKNGVEYLRMNDLFCANELLSDGVHPNSRGHKAIFFRVKKYLESSMPLS